MLEDVGAVCKLVVGGVSVNGIVEAEVSVKGVVEWEGQLGPQCTIPTADLTHISITIVKIRIIIPLTTPANYNNNKAII